MGADITTGDADYQGVYITTLGNALDHMRALSA
jgi:hypothetical protein